MIRKVSIALVAAVAPLVLAVAIGEITIQVKQCITDWLYGGLSPIVLWHLAWGILAALLFYLVAVVLPKYGGVPLIWGAGIGGVLVLAQSLVYLAPEVFWNIIPLHFHLETPAFSACGLFLTGNIICIIRTLRRNRVQAES